MSSRVFPSILSCASRLRTPFPFCLIRLAKGNADPILPRVSLTHTPLSREKQLVRLFVDIFIPYAPHAPLSDELRHIRQVALVIYGIARLCHGVVRGVENLYLLRSTSRSPRHLTFDAALL
jgi:hypothetical protein